MLRMCHLPPRLEPQPSTPKTWRCCSLASRSTTTELWSWMASTTSCGSSRHRAPWQGGRSPSRPISASMALLPGGRVETTSPSLWTSLVRSAAKSASWMCTCSHTPAFAASHGQNHDGTYRYLPTFLTAKFLMVHSLASAPRRFLSFGFILYTLSKHL